MKLLDRIASWFGYVPAERLAEACLSAAESIQLYDEMRRFSAQTQTGVRTPHIIVADFRRGIPCS